VIADHITRLAVAVIRVYRSLISPILPKACKFSPSCSEYAVMALEKYGLFKGSILALARILRCNPFSRGGYDPLT
jgi:putative membrane protein insertion efficiency factor